MVGVVGQHVPDRSQHAVFNGDYGLLCVAQPADEPAVLRGEVGVFAAAGGEDGDAEAAGEPVVAVAGLPGLAASTRFVVAGADTGPGRQMSGVGNRDMSAPVSAMMTSATVWLT